MLAGFALLGLSKGVCFLRVKYTDVCVKHTSATKIGTAMRAAQTLEPRKLRARGTLAAVPVGRRAVFISAGR